MSDSPSSQSSSDDDHCDDGGGGGGIAARLRHRSDPYVVKEETSSESVDSPNKTKTKTNQNRSLLPTKENGKTKAKKRARTQSPPRSKNVVPKKSQSGPQRRRRSAGGPTSATLFVKKEGDGGSSSSDDDDSSSSASTPPRRASTKAPPNAYQRHVSVDMWQQCVDCEQWTREMSSQTTKRNAVPVLSEYRCGCRIENTNGTKSNTCVYFVVSRRDGPEVVLDEKADPNRSVNSDILELHFPKSWYERT